MWDCACVMIVSCALMKDSGATITYEGDLPEQLDKLIASAKEVVELAENEA